MEWFVGWFVGVGVCSWRCLVLSSKLCAKQGLGKIRDLPCALSQWRSIPKIVLG